jgi:NNP family nitrate/nitrite transporter-like MFS transporter
MQSTDQSPPTSLPWAAIALNTFSFALGFAAWVIFGPSVRVIASELHLAPGTAALVKALPILVGSSCRIPVGIATDRFGARKMFPSLLLVTAGAVLATSFATSIGQLVLGGLALGLVGTTFTVGIQSVSSWTPKSRQGLALGIFGAGNVGTALTTFGFPLLMVALGWRGAFRVYAVVLAIAAVAYALLVRNAPRASAASPTIRTLLAPLKEPRAWRFGLYYAATFGVFVATTLTLSDVYMDGYGLSIGTAALLATTFTFSASLVRVLGGGLSDRFGARPVLRAALIVIVICLCPIALKPPLAVTVLLVFSAGLAMGVGMASSFKYIPQYYAASVGAVGGVVGALGGLGGFFLPLIAASVKAHMATPLAAVLPSAGLALVAGVVQHVTVRGLVARPAAAVADVVRRLSERPLADRASPSMRP